jgi:hypothetical protein
MAAAGLSGVHFHDLRHTGNTLTAQAGATLADLMARMRPASTRAPLNTTPQRDREVADALDRLIAPGFASSNGHAAAHGRSHVIAGPTGIGDFACPTRGICLEGVTESNPHRQLGNRSDRAGTAAIAGRQVVTRGWNDPMRPVVMAC